LQSQAPLLPVLPEEAALLELLEEVPGPEPDPPAVPEEAAPEEAAPEVAPLEWVPLEPPPELAPAPAPTPPKAWPLVPPEVEPLWVVLPLAVGAGPQPPSSASRAAAKAARQSKADLGVRGRAS
jgi:hypothetical protein